MPCSGPSVMKTRCCVNTATVDEERKNRGEFWVQLRNEIFATRT